MIKRGVLYLSTAAISCGFLIAGTIAVASSFAPTSVAGTVYSLTLNNNNGKITATSSSETAQTAKTNSGADFTFNHKGLSSSSNAFASFAANSYLITPNGVNGLTGVSANVASGTLYVSFASSERKANNSAATNGDGDWTYPVAVTTTVYAPVGMHYVKLFANSTTVVRSITFDYDCTGVATNDTNIRVYVRSDTGYTKIYAWDEKGTKHAGNWPGTNLNNAQESGWKTYQFSNKSFMNVIFNDGTNQTADLSVSGYGDHYYYNSAWYGYNPLNPSVPEQEQSSQSSQSSSTSESSSSSSSSLSSSSSSSAPAVVTFPDTVYFTNSNSWSNVYAYAWNAQGNNHNWPGVAMDYFYENQYGQEVYKITGMSSYTSIIFTNGSEQTVDVSAEDLGENNAYYLKNEKDAEDHYQVGTWYESGNVPLAGTSKGLTILHAFGWSVSTITSKIDEIAAAGYTAVQTSPLQPVKDYEWSGGDTHGDWWRYYQPLGFSVASTYGGKRTNMLVNGDDDLKALTAAANAKGIRVIVDIVCNHLAGTGGNGGLNPQVANFESSIYNNTGSTLHNLGKTVDDSDMERILRGNFSDCPDLNTANGTVQGRVLAYLKELIDDGVTGFRFDAAKHIETPSDGYYASDFWSATLGAAKTYAASKGTSVWAYGELVNPWPQGRDYSRYISAGLDAVTDSQSGTNWRNNMGGSLSGNYESQQSANHNVLWGESHDDRMGSQGATRNTDASYINNAYTMLTSRYGASSLYFVRPDTSKAIGTVTSNDWKCDYISAANKFHNELLASSEYISSANGLTYIERAGGKEGIAYLNTSNSAQTLYLHGGNGGATAGTYKRLDTGATVSVTNSWSVPGNSWGFLVKA